MQIWLNDLTLEVNDSLTLDQVLALHTEPGSTFAVAVNQVFIPKQAHSSTVLQPGDRLDLVTPMQGG